MSGMWLGPPCPACGKALDSISRHDGSHDPHGEPGPWQAGPCGCELTPEQAETLRTPREKP